MRRSLKRMIGGAAQAICPPGFFCMDTGFVVFVAVVFLAIGVALWTYKKDNVQVIIKRITEPSRPVIVAPPQQLVAQQMVPMTATPGTPLPPERNYDTQPDYTGFTPPPGVPIVPIQVPTRGLPEQFQQVGLLAAPGGSDTAATANRTLIPLYGRRVAANRERYNYYTKTDGYNPVQVPVSFKNRNCDDDNGCDEISTGDTVAVPLLGKTFTATTYKYNTPRYIPLVV